MSGNNPFEHDPDRSLHERLRNLDKLKSYSPRFANVDFAKLANSGAAFEAVEKATLAEAREALRHSGKLIGYSHRDDTGRKITKFEGDIEGFLGPFKSPPVRIRFNPDAGTHEETLKVPDGRRAVVIGPGERISKV